MSASAAVNPRKPTTSIWAIMARSDGPAGVAPLVSGVSSETAGDGCDLSRPAPQA